MKDILPLIKQTVAVRKFKNKNISDKIIERILEAGNWGFSILGIQAWYFVYIKNEKIIKLIAEILLRKSNGIPRVFGIVTKLTAKTIQNSKVIIAVYNTRKVSSRIKSNYVKYRIRAWMAEVQAIGGAIQNMYLEASSLGLGCVWVDSPTFFEKDVNKILKEDKELIAFLLIGYPAEKSKRSKRTLNIRKI